MTLGNPTCTTSSATPTSNSMPTSFGVAILATHSTRNATTMIESATKQAVRLLLDLVSVANTPRYAAIGTVQNSGCHASAIRTSPVMRAEYALVMPHPGQDMPVMNVIGHPIPLRTRKAHPMRNTAPNISVITSTLTYSLGIDLMSASFPWTTASMAEVAYLGMERRNPLSVLRVTTGTSICDSHICCLLVLRNAVSKDDVFGQSHPYCEQL